MNDAAVVRAYISLLPLEAQAEIATHLEGLRQYIALHGEMSMIAIGLAFEEFVTPAGDLTPPTTPRYFIRHVPGDHFWQEITREEYCLAESRGRPGGQVFCLPVSSCWDLTTLSEPIRTIHGRVTYNGGIPQS